MPNDAEDPHIKALTYESLATLYNGWPNRETAKELTLLGKIKKDILDAQKTTQPMSTPLTLNDECTLICFLREHYLAVKKTDAYSQFAYRSLSQALNLPKIKKIKHAQLDRDNMIRLGHGTFANVYKISAHLKKEEPTKKQIVAVKVLNDRLTDTFKPFLDEILMNALAFPQHEGVAAFLGHSPLNPDYYMVFEYGENGTLSDWIKRLSLEQSYRIVKQLASAILHLQQYNVGHFDIKPKNIILNHAMEPKLIDFGLAIVFSIPEMNSKGNIEHGRGSPMHMSPEMWLVKKDNNISLAQSDVYSFAVVLSEMANQKHLSCDDFPTVTDNIVAFKQIIIGEHERPILLFSSKIVSELAQGLWPQQPNERLPLQKVIERMDEELEKIERSRVSQTGMFKPEPHSATLDINNNNHSPCQHH